MKAIVIKEIATGKIIKAIDVTGQSRINREKVLMGIIHQMNQDKFIAYEAEEITK